MYIFRFLFSLNISIVSVVKNVLVQTFGQKPSLFTVLKLFLKFRLKLLRIDVLSPKILEYSGHFASLTIDLGVVLKA